ncbi:MAG: hypothetical protein WCA46_17220, partial [Actinocatenispora sp.]
MDIGGTAVRLTRPERPDRSTGSGTLTVPDAPKSRGAGAGAEPGAVEPDPAEERPRKPGPGPGGAPRSPEPGTGLRADVPGHLIRSGGVRPASSVREGTDRVLPVHPALRDLLPDGGLRRGSTVAVATTAGGVSLLFALLGTASGSGAWCALVGLPEAGAVSAAEFGVVPERFAMVPDPGTEWLSVTAALLDGFDLVVVRPPGRITPTQARRLAARARQRGAVLLAHGDWPGAEARMRPVDPVWQGLGKGRGRLRRRVLEIEATGRGSATRPRTVRVLLPSGATGAAAVSTGPG